MDTRANGHRQFRTTKLAVIEEEATSDLAS